METTIEYCTGRSEAFTEMKELLLMVTTSDKFTADQLEILIIHCENQINFENHHIDLTLESMEADNIKEV